jgi:hypothetical protein
MYRARELHLIAQSETWHPAIEAGGKVQKARSGVTGMPGAGAAGCGLPGHGVLFWSPRSLSTGDPC